MKFFATLLTLFPVALAVAPTSTVKRAPLSINPDVSTLRPKTDAAVPPAAPETNAKRMARGLPPLSPFRRHSKTSRALRPRQSSTPPTAHTGVIQAVDKDGNVVGYLGKDANMFGEYELTTDSSAASPISFSAPSDDSLFTISAPANSDAYPLLGGIVGFANDDGDLKSGSFHYVYLGGVTPSPEGAAVEARNTFDDATGLAANTESNIWSFDASTSTLTAHWINSDDSETSTTFTVIEGFFVATGDIDEFTASFGDNTPVTFKVVDVATAATSSVESVASSTVDATATASGVAPSSAVESASSSADAVTSSADAAVTSSADAVTSSVEVVTSATDAAVTSTPEPTATSSSMVETSTA